MTKHKYFDAIVAYANGENIQYKDIDEFRVGGWRDFSSDNTPNFESLLIEWRVKPKTNPEHDKIVDQALKNLDFDKILDVIRGCGIKWVDKHTYKEFTPTILHLLDEARSLCYVGLADFVKYGNHHSVEYRGFKVSKYRDIKEGSWGYRKVFLKIEYILPYNFKSLVRIE